HGPGDGGSDAFRIRQSKTLGHQLAQNEREIGDDENDEGQRGGFRIAAGIGHRRDQRGEGRGELRTAERAAEDADKRDADLLGGKKTAGFGMKMKRRLGAGGCLAVALTLREQSLKALPARGNDRHFRQRKISVEKNQNEQDDDVSNHRVPGDSAAPSISRWNASRDDDTSGSGLWFSRPPGSEKIELSAASGPGAG